MLPKDVYRLGTTRKLGWTGTPALPFPVVYLECHNSAFGGKNQ